METKGMYSATPLEINPNSLLVFGDALYEHPTPQDIEALQACTGWNKSDIAKRVGVSYSKEKGSTTVRKWLTDSEKESRKIPYASWRLLLIYANLVPSNDLT
jgi:hypothetical protein